MKIWNIFILIIINSLLKIWCANSEQKANKGNRTKLGNNKTDLPKVSNSTIIKENKNLKRSENKGKSPSASQKAGNKTQEDDKKKKKIFKDDQPKAKVNKTVKKEEGEKVIPTSSDINKENVKSNKTSAETTSPSAATSNTPIPALSPKKTSKITIISTARERCTVSNCPTKRGKCTPDKRCTCFTGYISVKDDYLPFFFIYEQKKQIFAFLLEFGVGFGVGHLYMGNIQLAMCKLITFCTAYFILCFLPHFSKKTKSSFLANCLPFLQTLSILTVIAWQIVDSVLIAMNYYKDKNGIPLLGWDFTFA